MEIITLISLELLYFFVKKSFPGWMILIKSSLNLSLLVFWIVRFRDPDPLVVLATNG